MEPMLASKVPSMWLADGFVGAAVWQVTQSAATEPSAPSASQEPSWALPVMLGVHGVQPGAPGAFAPPPMYGPAWQSAHTSSCALVQSFVCP